MKEPGEPRRRINNRWEFGKLEKLGGEWEGKIEKELREELNRARKKTKNELRKELNKIRERIRKAYEKKEK